MTPLEFAQNLVRSDKQQDRILGVAIVTRGLTDDDGLRQGWPLNQHTVKAAARHLDTTLTTEEVGMVIERAPKLIDATLNKGAIVEEVEFCDCTNEELEAGRICDQPQCPNRRT